MDTILEALIKLLDQISVKGDDVERMAAARRLIRQIQTMLVQAKASSTTKQKE